MLLRLLDIETSQVSVIHHLCDYPFSNPKPGGIKCHFRLTFAYALRPRFLSDSLYLFTLRTLKLKSTQILRTYHY